MLPFSPRMYMLKLDAVCGSLMQGLHVVMTLCPPLAQDCLGEKKGMCLQLAVPIVDDVAVHPHLLSSQHLVILCSLLHAASLKAFAACATADGAAADSFRMCSPYHICGS